jgi:hypothetical protein
VYGVSVLRPLSEEGGLILAKEGKEPAHEGGSQHCFECGSVQELELHHVVPVSLGGTSTVWLCSVCHGKVHGTRRPVSAKTLTKRAMDAKRDKHERINRHAPLGCRFEGSTVVEDASELATLQGVRFMRGIGMTLAAIAAELNRRGVRNRTGALVTRSNVHTMSVWLREH